MLWSQKLKKFKKLKNQVNETGEIFSPQMSASWCDLLNEGANKLTGGKHFLLQNLFWGISVCRKCEHYPQGSFVLLSFYGEFLVIYR